MVRTYHRKTTRPSADRKLRVTFTHRDEIDAEKIAEVLIRVALRNAGQRATTGAAGTRLQQLLAGQR
ncbi:hypothetical protein [Sanguibacter keddieii]|jgi:hypothetical protein|uniref:hypothetical protein n=1 Tax=Sanguibacter keddieii TaxID=60920 RepID=UPI000661773C|nr:hypothetical protein [Sanguibacter keddieii]